MIRHRIYMSCLARLWTAHAALVFGAFCIIILLVSATAAAERPSTVLYVGGNDNFAPYEFVNAKGEPDGYTVELMKSVARQLGVEVRIDLGPWRTMVDKLQNGEIDALTGVLYSQKRDQYMDFSVPHIVISYAIFVRENEPYRSVDDLREKSVIVVNGVYAHDWLLENNFTKKIVPVSSPQEALKLLSSGKHDFAVLPRLHGLELVRRLKIQNVETVGPPVLSQKFCFAVKAGNADLLADLNEGLVSVQKNGDYDRLYLKWFSLYEQKQRYWHYILRGGGLFLLLALLIVFWNLSLKKRVAVKTRALRKSRAMLSQIVQGLPMPTLVVDRNNRVTHWNSACEELTGVAAEQVLGTHAHHEVFYKHQRQSLSQAILCNEQNGNGRDLADCIGAGGSDGACEAEFFFRKDDGQSKWLCGTAAPLRDAEGGIIGAIESWQDLTEYKRMEAQLLQSQKMEAIGTLAGGIAHDFNNMLTAIMAYAELSRRASQSNKEGENPIEKLLGVCDHAKRLIRRLLTFSRQTEVEIKPVRIDNLVKDAVELIRATLPSAMQIHCDLSTSALVAVDATQIHQVLMNLCANAAHAMGGKQGTLTVVLTAVNQDDDSVPDEAEKERGTFVKLSVSDTGHGIPEEIIDRIFDPFFSTKKRGEGTGMGLAVSHGIVKRFGGAITVKSRLGQGTTFNVFLPVIPDQTEMAPFDLDKMPKGREHLFIVGQNTTPLNNIINNLEALGYRLTNFNSREEALVALDAPTNGRPDLLMLTGQPSDPEQQEAIDSAKSLCPDLPIILATGYGTDAAQASAERFGISAVIHEPIIIGELARLLRDVLDEQMVVSS